MTDLARLCVILILTLGLPLHNFVLRVANASASECVLLVEDKAADDSGQAVPDTPAPSCKVIGTNAAGSLAWLGRTMSDVGFAPVEDAVTHWWPSGPEKPPKHG